MAKKDYVFRYGYGTGRSVTGRWSPEIRSPFWFDEDAIRACRHCEPQSGPGTPKNLLRCCYRVRAGPELDHLSLRATQGLLSSLVEVMELARPVPDDPTVSRRQNCLTVSILTR